MKLLIALFLFCGLAKAEITQEQYEEIYGTGLYNTSDRNNAERKERKIRDDFSRGDFRIIADRTDTALNAIMQIGIRNLERFGHKSEATKMRNEWRVWSGSLSRLVSADGRNIGDFKPFSDKIAAFYEILELSLGYDRCYLLRLSDIKTVNSALPVVFDPCTYGLTEFEMHFGGINDPRYRSLIPVVSFWLVELTCGIATYGAGTFFICSPIASLVEYGVDSWVCPAIAPKIYQRICG